MNSTGGAAAVPPARRRRRRLLFSGLAVTAALAWIIFAWIGANDAPGRPERVGERALSAPETSPPVFSTSLRESTDGARALPALADSPPVALGDASHLPEGALAAPLRVVVVDDLTHQVVPGAHVSVWSQDMTESATPIGSVAGDTGADGALHLQACLGFIDVIASTNDGRFGRDGMFHSGLDEAVALEVHVKALVQVRGIVLDDVAGTPLAGAVISSSLSTRMGRQVRSDEHGLFRFDAWVLGAGDTLAVKSPGYGTEQLTLILESPQHWARLGRREEDIAWSSDEPFVEVRLKPDKLVRGRIVDGHGQPVADAPVSVVGYVASSFVITVPDGASTHSDAQGRFEVRGLRAGVPHLVRGDLAGGGTALGLVGVEPGEHDLGDLVFMRASLVCGSVVDSGGQAVVGAAVELYARDPPASLGIELDAASQPLLGSIRAHASVQRDGSFQLQGVAGSTAWLTVTLAGQPLLQVPVEIGLDTQTELSVLTTKAPVRIAEGFVRRADGSPLAALRLRVVSTNGLQLAEVGTDAAGHFALALSQDDTDALILVAEDASGRMLARWSQRLAEFPVTLRWP